MKLLHTLGCKKSYTVSNMCDKWVEIHFVHHTNLMKHFHHFHMINLNDKQNKIWKGVWETIVWMIWNHRNMIIFKKGRVDV